jgi:hypothetical protein
MGVTTDKIEADRLTGFMGFGQMFELPGARPDASSGHTVVAVRADESGSAADQDASRVGARATVRGRC